MIALTDCDSAKLLSVAVGALLGAGLTFLATRANERSKRADVRSDRAAILCTRGLAVLTSFRDFHAFWKKADAVDAAAAADYFRATPFLAEPATVAEFVRLCRDEAPFPHAVSAKLEDVAVLVTRLSQKHDGIRQRVTVSAQMPDERAQYSTLFADCTSTLAALMILLSTHAPKDSQRAVKSSPAVGEYRGNA